jgi:nitrate/nitrite-specific signal transduction histidine kinase
MGLQERALMLAGTLTIRSAPGAGTSVVVTFPAAAPASGRPALRVSET